MIRLPVFESHLSQVLVVWTWQGVCPLCTSAVDGGQWCLPHCCFLFITLLGPWEGQSKYQLVLLLLLLVSVTCFPQCLLLLNPCMRSLYFLLATPGLSCGIWDLVPWPRIKPRSPALGCRVLTTRTTRETPPVPSDTGNIFVTFYSLW